MGVRARVVAILVAAVTVAFGPMALTVLSAQRTQRRAEIERRASTAAELVASRVRACADEPCRRAAVDEATRADLRVKLVDSPCCASPAFHRVSDDELSYAVERPAGAQTLRLELPVRADSHEAALLGALAAEALLVVLIGFWLFERGFIRPLRALDDALGRVERLDLESPFLLARAGDELGRVGGTMRRMAERIREDKLQSVAQIDELSRTNKELGETREGLVRSEKLATVGRLAAGVAHEIGNPVAAILGYLALVRSRPAQGAEYLERIEREAERIDRIVRELLDFARPRDAEVGPTSLVEVANTAARLVEPQPKWRQMKLGLALQDDLPAVVAEPHAATQVLVNLLINAADACGGKGAVRLEARAIDEDAVELAVTDDGPGIAPADLPRLFDPFFTTKAPGEGTGLGLSICHRLMESFGGSIRATNGDGRGATFTLRFRRARDAQGTQAIRA